MPFARFADPQTIALQLGIAFVLTFLLVLLVRYVVLLWLGYLHHIENRSRTDDDAPTPRVAIIVPVYNEESVIESAVRSLLALDYPEIDIIVVDDGSTDRTLARASALAGSYGASTVRVLHKANGGKASALNTGIAAARTDLVLCMDGDSRLAPDTLRYAVRHFTDARVGAVAGNVKVVNRENLWTRLQALEYIEGLNMARRAQGFLHAVNIIPGPIGVFRRELLLSLGGYHGDTYAEDADLTVRILTEGWHVVYEERAIVFTEAPEQYLDLVKQRYRWTRGILQTLRKHTWSVATMRHGGAARLSVAAMAFEALIWPILNVLGNALFTLAALSTGAAAGVIYWWMLLTMLDVAAALHTVGMEEEDLRLVPYAVVYRLMFTVMVDVAKLFAVVEEVARVEMTWGKLDRAGRI
jgi:cellulose synthase/poly-beta-1,6-N-acetylglucosamine synthase-like glycosyltransferase